MKKLMMRILSLTFCVLLLIGFCIPVMATDSDKSSVHICESHESVCSSNAYNEEGCSGRCSGTKQITTHYGVYKTATHYPYQNLACRISYSAAYYRILCLGCGYVSIQVLGSESESHSIPNCPGPYG